MDNIEQERIDGAMLIGFSIDGDTLSTKVSDQMVAQELYHYLEPVAEWRSIDEPNEDFIVSWRPHSEFYPRVREWRENGVNVPQDVRISEDTLSLLASLNASERVVEEGQGLEISLPPLSQKGLRYIKQHLITQHGIIATSGYGVEPLRLDEDAREQIEEYQEQFLQKS